MVQEGTGDVLEPTHAPTTGLFPFLGCFNIGTVELPPYNNCSSGRASHGSRCWGKGANPQVSSPYIQSVINPQNPDLSNFERDRTLLRLQMLSCWAGRGLDSTDRSPGREPLATAGLSSLLLVYHPRVKTVILGILILSIVEVCYKIHIRVFAQPGPIFLGHITIEKRSLLHHDRSWLLCAS